MSRRSNILAMRAVKLRGSRSDDVSRSGDVASVPESSGIRYLISRVGPHPPHRTCEILTPPVLLISIPLTERKRRRWSCHADVKCDASKWAPAREKRPVHLGGHFNWIKALLLAKTTNSKISLTTTISLLSSPSSQKVLEARWRGQEKWSSWALQSSPAMILETETTSLSIEGRPSRRWISSRRAGNCRRLSRSENIVRAHLLMPSLALTWVIQFWRSC